MPTKPRTSELAGSPGRRGSSFPYGPVARVDHHRHHRRRVWHFTDLLDHRCCKLRWRVERGAAGALYLGILIAFIATQNAYCLIMMVPKVYNLSTWVYELYHLSPADSVLARRSLLGYNQLGALNVLSMSVSISWILPLLPAGSCLVGPVVLFLLLLMYLFTAVGTLLPRLLMGRMIRAKKEEEMETLQVRLQRAAAAAPGADDGGIREDEAPSGDPRRHLRFAAEPASAGRDPPHCRRPPPVNGHRSRHCIPSRVTGRAAGSLCPLTDLLPDEPEMIAPPHRR